MTIRVKDWPKFQHFRDRNPIWIKLYRSLIDDPDWHDLDGIDAKNLVMIWLIASEDESKTGTLPDRRKLAFRLRMKESQLDPALTRLSHWLVQDDIGPISDGYQLDAPEKEREKETEREVEKKKKGFTPPSLEDVTEYCKARDNGVDPVKFHAHYTANGWRVGKGGLPMKDWKAAVVSTWEK